jgi:acyl-CoA thioesterase-1
MAAGALLVALAGCGGAKQEPAAVKSPPPVEKPASTLVDTRPVIAAFGDSLSAGLGLDAGQSYPDRVQQLIDRAGYRYRVVNLGVSGDTTTDGVERLPSVLALHPSIVILEFGANDGLRGQPVVVAKKNMAQMIEALRQAGAQIVLAGMTLPRNYGPDYIHSFEQMYVELATQYKLVRIPFLLEGVGGNASLTQPDGLHPTAQGAEIVSHTVMKYLEPLLK